MALAPALLDQEDAIDAAMRLVMDGVPVPEAAAQIYRMGLDPHAVATFAIRGIVAIVHHQLNIDREEFGAEPSQPARGRVKNIHHAKALWEQVLSRPYWTPEGERPLLSFTLADVRSLCSRSENQVDAWRKRRDAMRLAERLMVQRKVDVLRDLPADDLAAIAETLR